MGRPHPRQPPDYDGEKVPYHIAQEAESYARAWRRGLTEEQRQALNRCPNCKQTFGNLQRHMRESWCARQAARRAKA